MFDDQTTQAQTNNHDDNEHVEPTPHLGMNPNPTYVGPSDNVPPAQTNVVLPDPEQHTAAVPASLGSDDELVSLKAKALSQLSPLVHQLEQNPEEKYKTLMMMIQASDNKDLLGEAYEAAEKITDEKIRAEALLNIVNEINYFTQKAA